MTSRSGKRRYPAPDTGAASNGEFVNEVVERGVKSDVENGEESGERRQRLNNGGFISGGGGRKEGQARRLTLKDLVYEMQTNPAAMAAIDSSEYYLYSIRNDMYGDSDMNSGRDENNYVGDEENAEDSKRDDNDGEGEIISKNDDKNGCEGSKSDKGDAGKTIGSYSESEKKGKKRTLKHPDFLPFNEAREVVRTFKFKNVADWREWSRLKERPTNFPSNPYKVYKKEWKGWGDWIGTGRIAPKDIVFLSFEDAREKVRALNLGGWKEWREWSKTKERPKDIPSNPDQIYGQQWRGWGFWTGTGPPLTRPFLHFTEARKRVRALNFKEKKDWTAWSRSKLRPKIIPSDPDKIYKEEWRGMEDWLGIGTIHSDKYKFLSFIDAREKVRKLNLKGQKEFEVWSRSGLRPKNIPSRPDITYRQQFQGWEDWVGASSIPSQSNIYLSFTEAREVVRALNIVGKNAYTSWLKSKQRPKNIPYHPDRFYKKEWRGWTNWTTIPDTPRFDSSFLSFTEARKIVRAMKFEGRAAWTMWSKSNPHSTSIPSIPHKVYAREWQGWDDWIGIGQVDKNDRAFLSFTESREIMKKLKLSGLKEFNAWSKSDNRPANIPVAPHQVYKEEWQGYGDWLGTGTVANHARVFLSFSEAREKVRALNLKSDREWRLWSKSGRRPMDIPACPPKVYKEDWKGMGDWLGTGTIANQERTFLKFTEARKIARALNLKSEKQWREWAKSKNRPLNIPSFPTRTYKGDWKSWRDWLSY